MRRRERSTAAQLCSWLCSLLLIAQSLEAAAQPQPPGTRGGAVVLAAAAVAADGSSSLSDSSNTSSLGSSSSGTANAQLQEQQQRRSLLAGVRLYCNVTGSCRQCKPEHAKSEACRPTGHAERLACVTTDPGPAAHQVVLNLHRRINVQWQPLHISRSCAAPQQAAAAPGGAPAAAAGANATAGAAVADDQAVTQHDSPDGGGAGGPSRASLPQPRLSVSGGLNILYFELAMLLVLAVSLPGVFLKKRAYVRL